MSSSATAGISQASSDTRSSTSITLSRSTAGAPRNASSMRATRVREIRSRARKRVQRRHGDRRVAEHLDRNAAHAEIDHRAEGRDRGRGRRSARGRADARPSSAPGRRGNAPAAPARRAGVAMASKPRSTSSTFASPSSTPPTSLLCVMPSARTLRTTGKPSCNAACRASIALRANRPMARLDAERREQGLAVLLVQRMAAAGARAVDDPPRGVDVELQLVDARRRHLQSQFPVAHELREVAERLDAALGRRHRGQGRGLEHGAAARGILLAQPGGHHRLFGRGGDRQQRLGRALSGRARASARTAAARRRSSDRRSAPSGRRRSAVRRHRPARPRGWRATSRAAAPGRARHGSRPTARASSTLFSSTASAASAPGPPPLDRMASRLPRGSRPLASVSAAAKRCPIFGTRIAPARRRAASKTASLPTSAPVWLIAVRPPVA